MNTDRDRIIVRASVIGILTNVALAAFKAFVGMASNSVAIVMDAVNNLSDALSSIITIVGTKLAAKPADRKHPLGYGRIEYLSATIIATIVLYAGLTSLTESVRAVLNPKTPHYETPMLIIIAVAVVAKIVLGLYVRKTGKTVSSDALVASGNDALFDAAISSTTLAAAIIYLLFGVSLESWLGVGISLVIVKSGFEMLRDTISAILGERVDAELASSVRASMTSFDEVYGAYDLMIHNYGPTQLIGSAHIEVPDTMSIRELDKLERDIARRVHADTGVAMVGISVYARNTGDSEAAHLERAVRDGLRDWPGILQLHGFYVEEDEHLLRFDCVLAFDVPDQAAEIARIRDKASEVCPGYEVIVSLDYDITD